MFKLGGRCACIVPNGVLFKTSSKAYTQLRRELMEKQKLEAVIYMPSGVFKPYSGASTAILVPKAEIVENEYDFSFNKYTEKS